VQHLLIRHTITGTVSVVLTWLFWQTRPEWDSEMRFWKALGDTSLVFLYATLLLGPFSRFYAKAGRLLKYRHELGLWFGFYGLFHTVLILNGWVRWDPSIFMGYQFVQQAGRMVRLESGFGFANIAGLAAMIIAIPLMITSGQWAVRYLGGSSWRYLHLGVYPIFYLVALHTTYYMYVHFSVSFHRAPPPENWAQVPFAIATFLVFAAHAAGYTRTFLNRRSRRTLGDTPASPWRQFSSRLSAAVAR